MSFPNVFSNLFGEDQLWRRYTVRNFSAVAVNPKMRKPTVSRQRNAIYTGKSKTCCIKWQVIYGHIIQVDGPFSSLDFDGTIWNETHPHLDLWVGVDDDNPEHSRRYEVIIGDNHYMNGVQCTSPIKTPSGKTLDPLEQQYNNFLGSVRSTIEKIFGYLKTWAILSTVYRGMLMNDNGYSFLCTAFFSVANYTTPASLFLITIKERSS